MDKENFTLKVTQQGRWDILEVSDRNFQNGYLYREEIVKRSQQENPRPFIFNALDGRKATGTAASRVWIHVVGNAAAAIGIPMSMLRDPLAVEFFPFVAPNALKEVGNHYAPGAYCTKFPNDVVCLEHGKKSAGILSRKEHKFVVCIFGFNLVGCPPDDQLRTQGLRACYMKLHTQNPLPTPQEFSYAVAEKIFELYDQHRTLDEFHDWINKELNVYKKKTYRVEVHNPNADIYKDGFLWTQSHPNALTKGYLNGDEYDCGQAYLFDMVYYENFKGGDPNKKVADETTKALKEQREKEKKEAEEKKKQEEGNK